MQGKAARSLPRLGFNIPQIAVEALKVPVISQAVAILTDPDLHVTGHPGDSRMPASSMTCATVTEEVPASDHAIFDIAELVERIAGELYLRLSPV